MDKKALIQALRDTAQSASNAIASNVSGPVDLIAASLRGVGLPANNPVGGSQWMAENGLTREVEMGAPRIVGETLGMVGPALATKFAPQIAGALNQGAANLAAGGQPAMRAQMGAVNISGGTQKLDNLAIKPLTTVNPTGTVFTKYDPISRANAPLSENITTLDKTIGGLPDDIITIYRGAPKTQKQINAGDFITTDARLAKDYAGTGHVISQRVRKKDILDQIDEPFGGEYIYRPNK